MQRNPILPANAASDAAPAVESENPPSDQPANTASATNSAPRGASQTPLVPLIQRIKDRMPLLDFVKQHTTMKQSPSSKAEHFGKCIAPDHKDDGPSFYVNTDRQVFQCKGCGVTGNVVGAYALIHGLELDDAKFKLGRDLGVFNERRLDDAESMLSSAASTFSWQLDRMEDAKRYLHERGLKDETIKKFGLGFCWGREFQKEKYQKDPALIDLAISTGLARERDPSMPNEPVKSFMTRRITFPVKDRSGRVVGFAGRILPDGRGPKYMNSPETAWFKKSELLYGAHEAATGISKSGYAAVVEGYMDVAMLHQCGVDNAVAVMGASANERTFASLWAMTTRVVFCLDGDDAGIAGAMRSVMAAAPTMPDGCEIAIARLPSDMDPDEYVLKFGESAWRQLCEVNALPLSKFVMESSKVKHDLTYPEGRARFLADAQMLAAAFAQAPLLRAQIVAEARAISATALVDEVLNGNGMGDGTSTLELRDSIALLQRHMQSRLARQGAAEAVDVDAQPSAGNAQDQVERPATPAEPAAAPPASARPSSPVQSRYRPR
ncbi:DNA primase [Roseateles asaccharophilus]|uniref:DNA primase n=1 Tax=Roseateles asaccharophilus TaxID=582607 RepID=UPI003839B54D